MAKQTITHSCGHTATHQLCGPMAGRTRAARQLSNQLCVQCRDAARAAKSAEAAAAAWLDGLPLLDGTDTQVAYAETVRHRLLGLVAQHRYRNDSCMPTYCRQYLCEVTDAGWWADRAHYRADDVIELLCEALAYHGLWTGPRGRRRVTPAGAKLLLGIAAIDGEPPDRVLEVIAEAGLAFEEQEETGV